MVLGQSMNRVTLLTGRLLSTFASAQHVSRFPCVFFFFFINFKAGDFISSMGCWGASPIRFKLEINSSFFLKKNKTLKNYMKKELVVLPCTPHKRPQLKQAFSKTWAKDL